MIVSERKMNKLYEEHLNNLYSEVFHLEQIQEDFCYLNEGKIRKATLTKYYFDRKIGTLLKKFDPIGYQVGFNEWKQEKYG